MKFYIDKNIGINGLRVYWMHSNTGKNRYWCRRAIAIFGNFNMIYEDIVNLSPFDPKFNGNYVEGKGATKEDALAEMEKNEKRIADSLWM